MKKVIIKIVRGSDGYSLQVVDKDGSGYRYAGPKAWGNPTNVPTCQFEVEIEYLKIEPMKEESGE